MEQTSQKKQAFRRKIVVDTKLQTYYLTTWLILSFVVIGLMSAFVIIYKVMPARHQDPVVTHNLNTLLLANAIFLILYAVMLGLQALIHSHRIAGAATHIKNVLEAVDQGDWSRRIHLRRKDYLKGVAERINHMIDGIEARKASFLEVAQEIEALKEAIEGNEAVPEELRNRCREIAKRAEGLREALPG